MIGQAVILLDSNTEDGDRTPWAGEQIAGLPLLQRIILSLARSGISRVLVVGTLAPAQGQALLNDARYQREQVQLSYIHSDAPADRQLVSAHDQLRGSPFLLCRPRHVHDMALIRALADIDLADGEVAVALERDRSATSRLYEPEVTGGVALQDKQVVAFHRAIEDDDAIDCGLYALTPVVLGYLQDTGATLSQALQHFAERKRAIAVTTDGKFWTHISSPAVTRAAEQQMLRRLAKHSDGPILQLVNRRLSRRLTALFMRTSATPNQLTILASMVGFLGIFCVFQATWLWLAVGALLMEAQMTLDCCDGEIARLKFNGSRFGEWLDTVMDDALNMGYALSLGWASKGLLGEPAYWWLAIGAVGAYLVYDVVLYTQLSRVGRGTTFFFRWWFQKEDTYVKESLASGGPVGRLVGMVHSLARRDVFLFCFMLLAVARLPHIAVIWYAISGAMHGILAVIHAAAGGIPDARSSVE